TLGLPVSAATETAATDDEPVLKRISYVSSIDDKERDFYLYLPRGYHTQKDTSWPVLMFLHGNGERGDGKEDLDYVLVHGPMMEAWAYKKDLPMIIVSPQLQMFDMDKRGISYIDNRTIAQIPRRQAEGIPERQPHFATPHPMSGSEAYPSMNNVPPRLPEGWDRAEKDLLQIIKTIHKDYNADPKRLYLTGLSYGGFGTWWMASKHPELFAAIAPVVGWGHPNLMGPIAKAQIPVWQFAGGRDPTVPITYFYPGLNRLEQLGHPRVRFTNHEDMGHDAWRRVYSSDDFYQWLLQQRR
ncbi:MAG TPA: prolyl oligopeptidase family serine peptidase, partial [Marinobacter sp.]|nr:prolyl oligopeptidase family serine peptidase [Marinobacter sp.]